MKVLRGLYVGIVYILAMPLTIVFAALVFLAGIKHPLDTLKAMYEGFKLGHGQSVLFIKYGRKLCK